MKRLLGVAALIAAMVAVVTVLLQKAPQPSAIRHDFTCGDE